MRKKCIGVVSEVSCVGGHMNILSFLRGYKVIEDCKAVEVFEYNNCFDVILFL